MNKDFVIENGRLMAYIGSDDYVEVPEGVREIGDGAFAGERIWCRSALIEDRGVWHRREPPVCVVLPKSVTTISKSAFMENRRLRTVVVPHTIRLVDDHAFAGCTSLENIDLPRSVELGSDVFADCLKLADRQGMIIVNGMLFGMSLPVEGHVDIPSHVTEIKRCAMARRRFSSVFVPGSVKRIWSGAFEQCGLLQKITIEGRPEIMGDIFAGCYRLETIECSFDAFKEIWLSLDEGQRLRLTEHALRNKSFNPGTRSMIMQCTESVMRYLAGKHLPELMKVCLDMQGKVRPDVLDDYLEMVKDDPELAAMLLEYKNRLYTPAELEQLESDNFAKELGLMDRSLDDWKRVYDLVVMEKGVSILGYRRKDIGTDEQIPAEMDGHPVIAIRDHAFKRSAFLAEVDIPASVHLIGDAAFAQCAALRRVTMEDGVDTVHRSAFMACTALEELQLSRRIHTIAEGAFAGCESLREIILPPRLTRMGTKVFKGCSALEEITIPGTLRRIGAEAFRSCTSLKRVVVEEGVTAIEADAFGGCKALKEIHLPASVDNISDISFGSCPKLTIVAPEGSAAERYAKMMRINYRPSAAERGTAGE